MVARRYFWDFPWLGLELDLCEYEGALSGAGSCQSKKKCYPIIVMCKYHCGKGKNYLSEPEPISARICSRNTM